MQRYTLLVALFALVFSACDSPTSIDSATDGPMAQSAVNSALGEDDATFLVVSRSASSLPRTLDRDVSANGGTILSRIPQIGIAVVASSNADFIADMDGAAGVSGVIPDMLVELPNAGVDVELQSHNDIPYAGGTNLDGLLWGLDAVNAPGAWAAGLTGAGVRVAVLDAGIDHNHPDLAPNLNASLSASFVPCIFGLNCDGAVEDWKIRPGYFFNHGTHVSGTVAATNDGNGVTGVAPEAEIVAVKACTEFANACFTSSIVNGMVHAADVDADVVNMSLGGLRRLRNDFVNQCKIAGNPAPVCAKLAKFNAQFQDDYVAQVILIYKRAFQYASQKGTTIVTSAGNSALDADRSKDIWAAFADYEHVIGVAALGPVGWCSDPSTDVDGQAYYTNTGRSIIDVSAPGGNFFGFFQGRTNPCTTNGLTRPEYIFDGVLSTTSEGWGWAQGTSMASPHAAGIAALIIEENGGSMSPQQVARELKARAEDLGSTGVDKLHGHGRVSSGY